MTREAVFITLCLLLAVTTSCFGFVQALLGGCDDIEKDLRFEKTLREKCNKELDEANQRAADADDVKRQLEDRQNDVKKLKNDIEKLKKEKEYVRGEASEYENMLIREQAECRKKDKRCKASEEQLQQSQNKLTECEDKLIDCGGTQSVQAKKHVEFLKGQIDDLKKHRDRLELELDETQTSFRNLRYTETICQSNYSDLVQQLSEYKNKIESLQNENQAYQKTGGAGGTLQFYYDYSHVLLAVAVILVFSLLLYINSLLEKVKHELREEAVNRRSSNLQLTEKLNKLTDSHDPNALSQPPKKKKTRKEKSVNKSENGEPFSADDEDEEDEDEEEQQESNAEDEKIEDNAGSSERLRVRRKPNHQASKTPKGEGETSASVMSVSGGTVSTKGEPSVKLEDVEKLIKTEVGGLVENEIAGLNEKVTTTMQQQVGAEMMKMENKVVTMVGGFQERLNKCEGQVNDGKNKTTKLEDRVADVETKMDERISGVESEIDKITKKLGDAHNELKKQGAVNQISKDGQTDDGARTGVFSTTDIDDGKNEEHYNEEVSKLGNGEPPGENIDRTSQDKKQTDPGMSSDEANLDQDTVEAGQPSQVSSGGKEAKTTASHGSGDTLTEKAAVITDPAVTQSLVPASGANSEDKTRRNSSGRAEEKECDPEAPPETPV